jgi:hypothetical protein
MTPKDFKYFTATLALSTLAPHAAHACATMSQSGRAAIATEQTIIVWDAAKKTEHFIRRLEFNTDAVAPSAPIGFLVPTPGVPQIAEASDSAFGRMQAWTAPKVEKKVETQYSYLLLSAMLGGYGASESDGAGATAGNSNTTSTRKSGVQVLSTQKVGALDATVLKGDAQSVVRWLRRNKYPAEPRFVRWLQPYASRGWAITAFKYAPRRGASEINTTTVRLSFETPAPFYPYREPQPKRGQEPIWRQMGLYVFAPQRVQGRVESKTAPKWTAETVWADKMGPQHEVDALAAELKIPRAAFGANPQLTAFVDSLAVRPDGDLRFEAATDQSAVIPPPIVTRRRENAYIPVDLAFLGGGLLLWRRRRRTRKQTSSALHPST